MMPVPTTFDRLRAQKIITALVVIASVGFIFSQLHPNLLFANTTTAGGDMGAHVWTPAYMRDHLLPHGRLTGWAPSWYGGFPALTFYFPLPSLLIVLGDLVLPYNIAFKLITVSGLVTLPISAWFFARSMKMRFPGPALLALVMVPFVFDRTFTIYGGNIASTLAGEFSFSMSLSLALVFLGFFARALDTGKYKGWAAVALAATGLCHIIPAFFAIAGALLLIAMRPKRSSITRSIPVFAVGGLLAGFWIIPFALRLSYTNDMGWEKLTDYSKQLFPSGSDLPIIHLPISLLFAWAALGLVLAVGRRSRTGLWIVAMAVIAAVGFRFAPQSRLWNARLLPFWFFSLYMLAGIAATELALGASWMLGELRKTVMGDKADASDDTVVALPRLMAPLLAVAYVAVVVGMPLQLVPSWTGAFKTADRSFVTDWGAWNYTGYERKASYPEYHDVLTTMTKVGKDHGCGRAMWEYEPELDRLGTPMALMLLPYWTDDCIDSMEGLFFESAASTPYHFLNQSEMSARPSRPQRDLPYSELNVAQGVTHLQELGVRYYMAVSTTAQAQADAVPDLELVATTTAWPATINDGATSAVQTRPWKIYLVKNSALVEPLTNLPAVMTKVPKGGREWQNAAVKAYTSTEPRDVLFAASGPKDWPRVASPSATPRKVPVTAEATVRHIVTTDDRISFDVDRVGVPVVVKTSYFPNWQASGANGPWRVTPNEMVVIPTAKHVSLHYGSTPVDYFANLATLAGAIGLALLWWRGRNPAPDRDSEDSNVAPPPPAEADEPSSDEADWLKELAGAGTLGT
ncbi:MAG: hypothetical protein QOF21_582 [Actinomycetota bacterium]|jgi:hypothetical protein